MGLIDRLLSLFGGGSKAAESEPEPEPEPEEDVDTEEEEEEEGGGDVPTKDVAAMADPRRREGEANTVHNRAENPADHEEAEAEAEGEEAEEEEEEGGGGMSTKAVAEMADPRRREGEANTVHNRAENPADHEEAEAEAEAEQEEEEGGGGMSTKAVAEMADPRRREGEANTVHNRAENPDDQRAT